MWIYCVEILFKVINGSIYDMFQMKNVQNYYEL